MAKLLPSEDQLRQWVTTGSDNPRRFAYPQEAREATLSIRRYCHQRCDDNLNTLVEHARLKGFNHDYNYFYQLLTARYFRPDKEGRPQGSWKTVVEIWRQLQVYDRFAAQLAKVRFVETSVWDRIYEYISIKRTPFNCCRFGGIIAPTGNQKSECFRELMRREKPGIITRIEAPAEPKIGQFIHKLGCALGANRSASLASKRDTIITELSHSGRVLIVDNVQRCYNRRSGDSQPIFEYLLEMQEDTNCTVILCWTPTSTRFEEAMKNEYFEQFVGRMGGNRAVLRIEAYPNDDDIEAIAASFGLPEGDIETLLPRLRSLVREGGRIRILFDSLQASARLAHQEKKPFRAHHLTQYLGD